MPRDDLPAGREEVFRRLYAAHATAVLGYALRRVDRPEDAADIVAGTFLVAWRRLGHVPDGGGTRPWLYGVARRMLANQRRGDGRRASLHHGRADLLEELLRTPVRDATPAHTPRETGPTRASTWRTPLAAAAVVAALAAVPLWVGADDLAGSDGTGGTATSVTDDQAYRIVLDAPGWKVGWTSASGLGISYSSGDALIEIGWRPASLYASYVADRRNISQPPADGAPVEVLDRPAQLWAYSRLDHTVIREPEHDLSYEIRGQGLSEADFRDILGRLRLVGLEGFEATLPARFVTAAERHAVIRRMLAGIASTLRPGQSLTPAGTQPSVISSSSNPYDLGIDVAGTVACGWLASYADGRAARDADQVALATSVLATSRQWPVVDNMDQEGDWPEVLWDFADDAAAGRDVDGYDSALGCP